MKLSKQVEMFNYIVGNAPPSEDTKEASTTDCQSMYLSSRRSARN